MSFIISDKGLKQLVCITKLLDFFAIRRFLGRKLNKKIKWKQKWILLFSIAWTLTILRYMKNTFLAVYFSELSFGWQNHFSPTEVFCHLLCILALQDNITALSGEIPIDMVKWLIIPRVVLELNKEVSLNKSILRNIVESSVYLLFDLAFIWSIIYSMINWPTNRKNIKTLKTDLKKGNSNVAVV